MEKLFYRPTGFDEKNNNNENKFKNLLKRPTGFDQEPKNKELNETIFDDPNTFLEYLYSRNNTYSNYERDINNIQRYLEYRLNENDADFMYNETKIHDNVNSKAIQFAVDETKSSDAFNISDSKNMRPESFSKINYRITLRNSPYLKTNELIEFIKAFKKEANNRDLFVNCKVLFEASDGIIFYVDKNSLPGAVKLLEDLKNESVYGTQVSNATKSFGDIQPFSATLSDDSYYSIAMHGVEPDNPRILSTRGGGLINTYNGHMDNCLKYVYDKLLAKHNQEPSKIKPNEMYESLIEYHQRKMKVDEKIPLWMNNRIYTEIKEKSFNLK